jgi:hypothetical protein
MPIPGYKLKSGNLVYVSKKYFYLLIGAAIPCVVTLLVFLSVSVYDWCDNHSLNWRWGVPPMTITATTRTAANTTNNQGVSSVSNTMNDDSLACMYLDRFKKVDSTSILRWNKDSMEQYNALKGLFEEIHKRKYSQILLRKETLKSSRQFNLLISLIETNVNPQDTDITLIDGKEIDMLDYFKHINQK